MKTPLERRRAQRSSVLVGLQLFNLVLILLQLWLFVTILEGLLGGETGAAVTAAIASVGILVVNIWILAGIYRMEGGR
ncbi:MAG: DUF6755 family protein [Fimbriimonadales bacterium]